MLKTIFLFLFTSSIGTSTGWAQIFIAQDAYVSFFSSAPLEDIEAISHAGSAALDLNTGDLVFKVPNKSFEFKKQLMQDHFNESYMESDRFPISIFKGKIDHPTQLKNEGTYIVSVHGILTVHGVARKYQTQVKMAVSSNSITATSSFHIKTADHNIKIPTIVIKNIAEVLDIHITASFKPKKF